MEAGANAEPGCEGEVVVDELQRIDKMLASGQQLRRRGKLKAAYVEESKRWAQSVPYLTGLGQGPTFAAW